MANLYLIAHRGSKAKDPFWRLVPGTETTWTMGARTLDKVHSVMCFYRKKDAQTYIDRSHHRNIWEVVSVTFEPKNR